jgi:SOS-response transcriptional repressor LexA
MQHNNSHNEKILSPIQKVLFEEMEERNMGRGEFAKLLGISGGYLSEILTGKKAGKRSIEEFSEKLGRNIVDFYEKSDIEHFDFSERDIKSIPVISWVSAGQFTECVDMGHPGESTEGPPISPPVKVSNNAFALIVRGDSMEPEYRDGDIIIVDPLAYVNNNDKCIVKINEKVTFKILVHRDGEIRIKSRNPKYPDQIITPEMEVDFKVIGKVVGYWRSE